MDRPICWGNANSEAQGKMCKFAAAYINTGV